MLWLVPVVILLAGLCWAGWRMGQVIDLLDEIHAHQRASFVALTAAFAALKGRSAQLTALLDADARR